jgi:hypothetical protein
MDGEFERDPTTQSPRQFDANTKLLSCIYF